MQIENRKYFLYQKPDEIRLVTTVDTTDGKIMAQMKGFRLETGYLKTWEKDEKMSVSFPDRLLKNGYEAISEAKYQEYMKSASNMLLKQAEEPQGEAYKIVPWETIETQYSPEFLNDVNEYLQEPALRKFCLYSGDTVIDRDLVIDYSELVTTAQTSTRNIIVNGNLTIKGNLDAGKDIEGLPQFIYITGNLYAENLILSGWLDLVVKGNTIVNNTILAYYGEPGGRLLVNGNLKTGYLLNGFMYLIEVKGTTNGICHSFEAIDCIKGFKVQAIKDHFKEEDELKKSPLEETTIRYDQDLKEYQFNFDSACKLLREGATIFKR